MPLHNHKVTFQVNVILLLSMTSMMIISCSARIIMSHSINYNTCKHNCQGRSTGFLFWPTCLSTHVSGMYVNCSASCDYRCSSVTCSCWDSYVTPVCIIDRTIWLQSLFPIPFLICLKWRITMTIIQLLLMMMLAV